MSIIEAIVLGILQGATEFLPISSSGHLVLIPAIFGLTPPDLTLIAVAHGGTLLAVLVFFRRELWSIAKNMVSGLWHRNLLGTPDARLGWLIVVGSIPTAVVGTLFNGYFDRIFSNAVSAAFFLLVTAGLLVIAEKRFKGNKPLSNMSWWDSLIIGVFQMLALIPGISRSGSTIVAGIFRGFNRDTSARYSFLLGVPVILGAGILQIALLIDSGNLSSQGSTLLAAFISAAVVGYACIYFLLAWLRNHSLYIFAVYCALLGGGYLLWTWIN
ncbi:MAG: undecaprenyl-diphosphate phosphatase [Candidatus Promineifilaceae bacterium]|nr:undecaprenyl-diphosphate phosphatase [Candidatus Promineifilaceae bacterium]